MIKKERKFLHQHELEIMNLIWEKGEMTDSQLQAELARSTGLGASDLHLRVGQPPTIRRLNQLNPLPGWDALAPAGTFAHAGGGPAVEAMARRDVVAPTPELGGSAQGAVELAPVDLAGIDLSALALAGTAGGGAGRPSGPRIGAPGVRAWLDALREATVRR